MSSIIRFLSKAEWRLSNLPDIHPALRGTKNSDLRGGTEEQKRLFALVEDVSIPVTVIRCDYTQRNHMLYLFTIFHRLNSGGVRLTNQEIRNCIYSGPFNDNLKEFDKKDSNWKAVQRRIWGSMDRYRSAEVLLRVLAFSEDRMKYDGNLARFLNAYMHKQYTLPNDDGREITDRLAKVMAIAKQALQHETRKKLPLVMIEALLVAIYTNYEGLKLKTVPEIQSAYAVMNGQASFTESARYAVTSIDNVKTRLQTAIDAFSA
jgi:hypothetical protein